MLNVGSENLSVKDLVGCFFPQNPLPLTRRKLSGDQDQVFH